MGREAPSVAPRRSGPTAHLLRCPPLKAPAPPPPPLADSASRALPAEWRVQRPGPRPAHPRPNRRSRSAFATTLTLDAAIAAPAITGLSRPTAASGIAATL